MSYVITIILLFLGMAAEFACVLLLNKKNKQMLKENSKLESSVAYLKKVRSDLEKELEEFSAPEGCKRGEWCKLCDNKIERHFTRLDNAYDYYGRTIIYTACGLGRCDKFRMEEDEK